MIELILTTLIGALLWIVFVPRLVRRLDAALAMDTLRPTAAEVADTEHQLPDLRDRDNR